MAGLSICNRYKVGQADCCNLMKLIPFYAPVLDIYGSFRVFPDRVYHP